MTAVSSAGRTRQRGYTIWGLAMNLLILGAVLILLLRVAPAYIEYLNIKDIVTKVAQQYDPKTQTPGSAKTRLRKIFHTNQITDLDPEAITVTRDKGGVLIDANYELRFPLFWILEGVAVFDDLQVNSKTVSSS
mgnify:CR=1 FL=1